MEGLKALTGLPLCVEESQLGGWRRSVELTVLDNCAALSNQCCTNSFLSYVVSCEYSSYLSGLGNIKEEKGTAYKGWGTNSEHSHQKAESRNRSIVILCNPEGLPLLRPHALRGKISWLPTVRWGRYRYENDCVACVSVMPRRVLEDTCCSVGVYDRCNYRSLLALPHSTRSANCDSECTCHAPSRRDYNCTGWSTTSRSAADSDETEAKSLLKNVVVRETVKRWQGVTDQQTADKSWCSQSSTSSGCVRALLRWNDDVP